MYNKRLYQAIRQGINEGLDFSSEYIDDGQIQKKNMLDSESAWKKAINVDFDIQCEKWIKCQYANIARIRSFCEKYKRKFPVPSNYDYFRFLIKHCIEESAGPSLDLNWIDTSNIIDMNSIFSECDSKIKTIDISQWNVSNVTTMSYLFYLSKCTTIIFPRWDTSNVKYMDYMFGGCDNLKNIDISNWNTRHVISMQGMFQYCTALKTLDISNWQMSNVINMKNMFQGCISLAVLNINTKTINTSFVDQENAFQLCKCNPFKN